MIGPGKYDEETRKVREETGSTGVLLLVVNGNRGTGFSAQLPPDLMPLVPKFLREVADQIEADLAARVGNR